MRLKELLKGVDYKLEGFDEEVTQLSMNSNDKTNNGLFFCINGTKQNGEDFALDAISNGAVVVVTQNKLNIKATQVIVNNVRSVMAVICANFYNNPAKKLRIIGVTGTNGKTTTTTMIYNVLRNAGVKAGLIGTTQILINDIFVKPKLTTPDPIDLHYLFSQMVNSGCEVVVMEVSAHALDLNKLDGIIFDIAVLTNVTEDHLDYFETMEKYKMAKCSFFTKKHCRCALVNVDDEVGKSLVQNRNVNTISYGITNPSACFAINLKMDITGSQFFVNIFDDIESIKINQPGIFNVYNALACISVCRLLNIDMHEIAKGLSKMKIVEGRFQLLNTSTNYSVIVDYAHTPDGLESVLKTAKSFCKGNLICVFGCGGNRDPIKRPIMGRVASAISDVVILTSDNPRYESPTLIINQIEEGVDKTKHYYKMENRIDAIAKAIEIADSKDIVMICGKGAEDYQEINGVKHHFNDAEEVIKILEKRKLTKTGG